MPDILRMPQVKARVGLCSVEIYRRIKAGRFPAPIKLDGRASGWLSNEIDQWIADRIAASRGN